MKVFSIHSIMDFDLKEKSITSWLQHLCISVMAPLNGFYPLKFHLTIRIISLSTDLVCSFQNDIIIKQNKYIWILLIAVPNVGPCIECLSSWFEHRSYRWTSENLTFTCSENLLKENKWRFFFSEFWDWSKMCCCLLKQKIFHDYYGWIYGFKSLCFLLGLNFIFFFCWVCFFSATNLLP